MGSWPMGTGLPPDEEDIIKQEIINPLGDKDPKESERERFLQFAQDPEKWPSSFFVILGPSLAILWFQVALGTPSGNTWQWRQGNRPWSQLGMDTAVPTSKRGPIEPRSRPLAQLLLCKVVAQGVESHSRGGERH